MTSVPTTRECPNCLEFDISKRKSGFRLRIPLNPDISSFLAEKRQTLGCIRCTLLFAALQQVALEFPGPYRPRVRGFIDLSGHYDPNKDPVGQPYINLEIAEPSVHFEFFRNDNVPCPPSLLPFLPLGNENPETTSSEASLLWAKSWLQTCTESHTKCKASAGSFFPARVLDVGLETEVAPDVRLLVSEGGEHHGEKYVCLSHCWGPKPFLQTLSDNIEDHKRVIALEDLPPNFQDAIDMTRRLGLRYIWIDSLCIVQDDLEDWRKESARMASIYEHAFLVLSATKSSDAYEGMYTSETHKTHTIKLPTSAQGPHPGCDEQHGAAADKNDDSEFVIFYRKPLTHLRGFSQWELPTTLRAWIFQERILSTRILHFGPEELTWECLESFACQCGLLKPYRDFGYLQWPDGPGVDVKRRQNAIVWQSMPSEELSELWHDLVYRYHQLDMTNKGDIFPAISGLAKHFQQARGSTYVAGLWRDDFPRALLWYRNGLPRHSYCSSCKNQDGDVVWSRDWHEGGYVQPWRAPTWSWASLKSGVDSILVLGPAFGLYFEPYCEIVAAMAQPAGTDPTGELLEGGSYLTITGQLIPAVLRIDKSAIWAHNTHQLDILQHHGYSFYVDDTYFHEALMGGFDPASSDFHVCDTFPASIRAELDPDGILSNASLAYLPGWLSRFESDDFDADNPAAKVYCLLIGDAPLEDEYLVDEDEDEKYEEVGPRNLFFLVLRRVTVDGEPDLEPDCGTERESSYRYTRVGALSVKRGPERWTDRLREKGEKRTVTIY
ncbi:heterokaryon incompatibility protein-domain-containing protein [Podospora aff. communis PSN243]|uniref:Heterokaryon incompatibility protein-domain-containing protein n=1 Tax=Podospora aff. communis PSN243 TaxID=3040156 RepID=A0AAV9H3K6_9PEZI|nr:heterokaryon incompatibility protein-domain-containing protein [Podospora aff. communis PSN243]